MKCVSLSMFIIVLLFVSGCYRMKMELVDASVQKPSNVALFFSLDDKSGNPKPGVEASQFKIYEDDQLISQYESKQTILNPEMSLERYTLLLLDMSGSVVDSGQVPILQEAVGAFLEDIPENEKVAIYAFDGRESIIPVAKFGTREESLSRKNDLLANWEAKDPSTNLHGAIIEAVDILEDAKSKSKVPLRFGTLVIFTDGTDRAHRSTAKDAMAKLDENKTTVFVIGLGGETSEAEMKRFGKDGFIHAGDKDSVVQSFEKVAEKINAHSLRYYLFSYCSPSRAGTHELRVEVEADDQKGKLVYSFDAAGFAPECDPNKTPEFKVPEPSSKKDDEIKNSGKSEATGDKGLKKSTSPKSSSSAGNSSARISTQATPPTP